MKLSELPVGRTAAVTTVGGEGALRLRLLDMGLTPGTRVRVEKVAPLGDPMQIELRGYLLTLRLEDTARIEVEEGKSA
jgi:Fe2+ transport system protein FeoA